jgi:hypothetical protein
MFLKVIWSGDRNNTFGRYEYKEGKKERKKEREGNETRSTMFLTEIEEFTETKLDNVHFT